MYLSDLKLAIALGVLADGCVVVADNILYPGAPDFKEFVTHHSEFNTTVYDTLLEYHRETPDQVVVSVYRGVKQHDWFAEEFTNRPDCVESYLR